MSLDTAREVAKFLSASATTTGASIVRIIFHGGEPMMVNPKTFSSICDVLVEEIRPFAAVSFSIQTNAMLVNEAWIRVFETYKVSVGISLDGGKALNDLRRVDHQDGGTYERAIKGSDQLFLAHERGRIPKPGVLCVIDPQQDGGAVFSDLVEAGFTSLDFLLPIDTHDTSPPDDCDAVGKYLEAVFRAWNERGEKSIYIRIFDLFYAHLTGFDRQSRAYLKSSNGTLILTIDSDGSYGPDDTLRVISDDYYSFDTRSDSIETYLNHPLIAELTRASLSPPEGCRECPWAGYCIGGSANGRVV